MKWFYLLVSIICLLVGIGVGLCAWLMHDFHIDIQPLANAVAFIGFILFMLFLSFKLLDKGIKR